MKLKQNTGHRRPSGLLSTPLARPKAHQSHLATHAKRVVLTVFAMALLAGCVRGDRLLSRSHAAYNEALRSRLDEEVLLNLVRLRYRDRPLFLQISSVIARFEREAGLSAQGNLDSELAASGRVGLDFGYSEQPTITFTPLQGEEFAERLLRPVDLETVALLQRSGWSIERVLRVVVQRMNGLDNAASASGPTPLKAPRFREFVGATRSLKQLQGQNAVVIGSERVHATIGAPLPAGALTADAALAAARAGHRFEKTADGTAVELRTTTTRHILRVGAAHQSSKAMESFREVLGLRSELSTYRLESASGATDDIVGAPGSRDRVVMVTRSLLGVLFFLCHAVEIPAEHETEGLVTVTTDEQGQRFAWSDVTDGLLQIRVSRSRPDGAAVSAPYRDHWFYIADDDLGSKSTFAMLVQLYALVSGDPVAGSAPVPTLPLGG